MPQHLESDFKRRKPGEPPASVFVRHNSPDLRVLDVGDYLYKEADPKTCVYRVEKGLIALFDRPPGRPGRIIEMVGHGDFFFFGLSRAP